MLQDTDFYILINTILVKMSRILGIFKFLLKQFCYEKIINKKRYYCNENHRCHGKQIG